MTRIRLKQSCIIMFTLMIMLSLTACLWRPSESTVPELKRETHKPLEELEQYVYDTVGPDIYFKKPVLDEEESIARLYLIQYEYGMDVAIFDRSRNAINEYLEQHPDYYLNSFDEIVLIYEKRKNLPGNDYDDYQVSISQNTFQCGGHTLSRSGSGVSGVNIGYDYINVVKVFSGFYLKHISDEDDVYALDMSTRTITYDEITEFITKHPSIQYISVDQYEGDEEELISFLQEVDSDVIIFIDEYEE